jgi:hypothetical protein
MFRHSTNTASFFSVLMAALIFSLSLPGVAAAQGNTSLGTGALQNNTTGSNNTAIGSGALFGNTTGDFNSASGVNALFSNTTGERNTAIGVQALVSSTTGDTNTASGNGALLNNTTGSLNYKNDDNLEGTPKRNQEAIWQSTFSFPPLGRLEVS